MLLMMSLTGQHWLSQGFGLVQCGLFKGIRRFPFLVPPDFVCLRVTAGGRWPLGQVLAECGVRLSYVSHFRTRLGACVIENEGKTR